MVARCRKRIVHPLQDRERRAVLERIHNLPRRERAEGADVEATDRNAFLVTEIIDGDLTRLHVTTHADDNELCVGTAVRLDVVVFAAGLVVEELESLFQCWPDAVV